MSAIINLISPGGKFAFVAGRIRILFTRHPEWWAWFLSLLVWALLVINMFTAAHTAMHTASIYCMPAGTAKAAGQLQYEILATLKPAPVSSRMLATILDGMAPWVIMVIAMMFPLLNESIRHVAFSVRRKDRNLGIFAFLAGYTITWTAAGVLFLLLPFFLDIAVGDQGHFVNSLVMASGFLLAAVLIWHPARPVLMMKCAQTTPIRIQGRYFFSDSVGYGLKMGCACLKMCWPPMAALILVHHNIMLMCAVTVVIAYERYLLPHTSKLPGYAWGIIAFAVFSIEMWA